MFRPDRPWGRCLLIASVLLVTGCGADGPPESEATDGEALYGQNCASCHGSDFRGTNKGPAHLSAVYEPGHHPDESFRAAVREGVRAHHWQFGDMPAIEGLDEDEVQAIIDYVRSVQESEGFEPYP